MERRIIEYANRSAGGAMVSPRWWAEDEPGRHVIGTAKQIETDQSGAITRALDWASLYSGQQLRTLYSAGVLRLPDLSKDDQQKAGTPRLTWNVSQSCVDTLSAKIAKNRPRVMFLTSGADWKQQQEARGLTKFTDGLFYQAGVYQTGRRCFVDSGVFGDGWLKVYVEEKQIKAERVLPFEIFVDESEAVGGEPQSLFQRKYIYRWRLAELFGRTEEQREAIAKAHGADLSAGVVNASDMVPVWEAWHLPSGKRAKDGRHVICVEGATLVDESWTYPWFPFARLPWTDRLVGIRGQGLVEQLSGIQQEINKLLRTIQQAQHLMAVPRVYVERGSKIVKSHLNNDIGSMVEYDGQPPQVVVGTAMSPEVYQHLERLYAKAYEIAGISQLSANASKPSGLDAAVALREYHDIESERFVVVGQKYEEFFIDVARIMIAFARDQYARGRDISVTVPGAKFLETVPWSSVALDEDAYVMRPYPTSMLPTTPAGRLQRVQELFSSGILTDQSPAGVWARSMLDFPDTEAAMSLQNAALDDAQATVARIVDEGVYEAPSEYQDLALLKAIGHQAYLRGRSTGLPDARLDLLQRLVDEADALQAEVQAGNAPPPPEAPPTMAEPPPAPMQGPPESSISAAVPSDLPV